MALIPPAAVQQHYGIPTNMLTHWRRQGTGPEYFALGHRSIRYYPADINEWLTNQNQIVLTDNTGGGNASIRWNG